MFKPIARLTACIMFLALIPMLSAEEPAYFLGEGVRYNPAVPTPSSVLGFGVGDWHVRHDQLVLYMNQLAQSSNRVKLEIIGYTHERRPLLNLIISTPANLRKLEQLRQKHLDWVRGEKVSLDDVPLVIQLGYSVHGNEASGSNAAPMTAYHLAAAENMEDMLADTIIILDPCLNPDGLDRFASWVNSHQSATPNPDHFDREHHERWPSGRTNHYWFDLNRDWLLLQHPESRARVAQFHKWYPNILTDFHEMGSGSTFFFQPGVPSRQNPLIPPKTLDLTRMIARYHAAAFDRQGVMYFSEQLFDDFYFGKGSTYPDIQGAIGILFEQASARGHVRENSHGGLTLAKAVKNQVTTTFSTLRAGVENRAQLLQHQRDFFNQSNERKNDVKAFVFGNETDAAREYEMLNIMLQHQIRIHPLKRPVNKDRTTISNGWVVPLDQPQRTLIKSLFDDSKSFQDQTFYDVSSWHFGYAFNTPFIALDGRDFNADIMGDPVEKAVFPSARFTGKGQNYAYLIPWEGYYAPRAAYELLENDVRVRFATNEFTAKTGVGDKRAKRGSLMIPMGSQDVSESRIQELLSKIAERDGLAVQTISTGLTDEGVDLGSPAMAELRMPKPLIVVGKGVFPNMAGEVWHLLDTRFNIPVTRIEARELGRADLSRYTHLILVTGAANALSKNNTEDVVAWAREGGTIIAMGDSVGWAVEKKLVKATWEGRKPAIGGTVDKRKKDKSTASAHTRRPFGDKSKDHAKHVIGGAVYRGKVDRTHPLGYGMGRDSVALFRDSEAVLGLSNDPYATVVQYADDPLLGGYTSEKNLKRIGGSAAVIAKGFGDGSIILMVDNPNFRGYWMGATKLFVNGLFFSSHL